MMDKAIDSRCACIVLAAGSSSRLGRPKQLLRMSGESLVHRAVRLALENHFAPVCVVLGSNADLIRNEMHDCDVLVVENSDWQQGMSSSLRAGIKHLMKRKYNMECLLVLVCDQPGLSAAALQSLQAASASHPAKIAASAYSGRLGVPAIFPTAYVSRLLSLEGDKGARVIIEECREHVVSVDFPQGALDIDTPEDAERAGLV